MRLTLLRLGLASSLALGAFTTTTAVAAPTRAVDLPPSLEGMNLSAHSSAIHFDTVEATYTCDEAGRPLSTISYAVEGRADGFLAEPSYPGVYSETGTITYGPAEWYASNFDPAMPGQYMGPVLSVESSFTIDSPAGHVTGTKTLLVTAEPQNWFARCFLWNGQLEATFFAGVTYDAIITTADGTFRDTGTANTGLQHADFSVEYSFLGTLEFVSDGVVPHTPGCTTPAQPSIDTTGGAEGNAPWYNAAPAIGSAASGVMWDSSVDGQARGGYSTTVPTLAPGTTTVFAKAVDDSCESTEASRTYAVDPIAPTVTCPSPSPTFTLNEAVAEVTASVADVISGPAATTVSADASTSTAGAKTVSLTGFDVAGNSTTKSCDYTVAYNATQFGSPVDAGIRNVAKAGQPLPLKFRLTDANGAPVLDLTSVSVTVASLACSRGVTLDNVEEYATGQSGLQNLGNGYYQYNWKTPKAYADSCKTMRMSLGEGNVVHTAEFEFRK